jgi:hypothetical protein
VKHLECSQKDLSYLRGLAQKQADLSQLPIMRKRKQMWTDMNDALPEARPPFVLETRTFDRDFLPENIFKCESDYGKKLENNFLRHIRHHEILGDDHVCPDSIDMNWHIWCNEYGLDIVTKIAKDSEGKELGYHFDCPIKDLSDGFDMVKPASFGVDRESTLAEKDFLTTNFGDILPVVIRSGTFGNNNLTQRLMRLMSMETVFLSMYDCPENLHGIMSIMRDNAKRMALWAEAEGLLVKNHQNQCSCGSCFNFTTLLPDQAPGTVKLKSMWSVMDSQETVGVSPELFHDFFFPYYEDLAKLYGLVYWGCCEPIDPIWENSISKLPNLKAVSISKWAKQEWMAEQLSGRGIVFSRKPDPNLLGVDVNLNEEAWRREIRSSLDAVRGKNVPLELVVRDVYSVHGNLGKAKRAVELAHAEIDKYYHKL